MHRVQPTRTGTVTHASVNATLQRYAIPISNGIARHVTASASSFSYAMSIGSGIVILVHVSVVPSRTVGLINGGTVRHAPASAS